MPHFWVEQRTGEILWGLASLDGGGNAFALSDDRDRPVRLWSGTGAIDAATFVCRTLGPSGAEQWLLYGRPGSDLRVNGLSQTLGMRVLRDKDRIHVGQSPAMFFSTERPARLVPFPDQGKPIKCPRCRRIIEPGTPAVRCPNPACGAWHHQNAADQFECWTYDTHCGAGCKWPTDLDGDFQWTPHRMQEQMR